MSVLAAAVERARGPQPLWALVPPEARARSLQRAAYLLLDEREALAGAIAASAAMPRTEALLAELLPSVAGLRALASDGPTALADRRLGGAVSLRRASVVRVPLGVVGIRAGTASPWAEPALEVAAALLAGNGVVLAARIAERLDEVLVRAGVPEGLVVPVDPATPLADLEAACDRALDCEPDSPKEAMLVLEGAPLGRAVAGALWAAFARTGRGPAAVGRVAVVDVLADRLVDGLLEGAAQLRVGDPADPRTDVGPLVSAQDTERVAALVDEAVRDGAELLCGGRRGERLFEPAILRGVAPGARLLREPVPGPVLAVLTAPDEAAAIGLVAGHARAVSVWAGDRAHGERIARGLGAARTWVNDHGALSPAAPARLDHHVGEVQVGSQPSLLRSGRWLPYDPALVDAATAAARLRHGRESDRLASLRAGALPLARVAVRVARDALGR